MTLDTDLLFDKDEIVAAYEGRPLYDDKVIQVLFDTKRFPGGAIRDGDVLADLGTGQGRFLTSLFNAPSFQNSGVSLSQIYAVDSSVKMLDALQIKFRERNNLFALEGRFQSLPLADASVDVITCAASLHWGCVTAEDTALTRSELIRVLKPEGRLIILGDSFSQTEKGGTREIHDLQEEYNDRFIKSSGMEQYAFSIHPENDEGSAQFYDYSPTAQEVRAEFQSQAYIDTLNDDEKAELFERLDHIMEDHLDENGRLHLQRASFVMAGPFQK